MIKAEVAPGIAAHQSGWWNAKRIMHRISGKAEAR
jgi:hypothetical protein